jgi:hypothetical protein
MSNMDLGDKFDFARMQRNARKANRKIVKMMVNIPSKRLRSIK